MLTGSQRIPCSRCRGPTRRSHSNCMRSTRHNNPQMIPATVRTTHSTTPIALFRAWTRNTHQRSLQNSAMSSFSPQYLSCILTSWSFTPVIFITFYVASRIFWVKCFIYSVTSTSLNIFYVVLFALCRFCALRMSNHHYIHMTLITARWKLPTRKSKLGWPKSSNCKKNPKTTLMRCNAANNSTRMLAKNE